MDLCAQLEIQKGKSRSLLQKGDNWKPEAFYTCFSAGSLLFQAQGHLPSQLLPPVYSWGKKSLGGLCTFSTLKFQLFPTPEESIGDC